MIRGQHLLLLVVAALLCLGAGPSQTLHVVGVHDGDTITGLDENKVQHKIRLDAIDAPELGQPFGQAAKKALSDKVFGKDVVVVPKTKDKYGRTIGHVMIDGRDVNLEMLEEGMACTTSTTTTMLGWRVRKMSPGPPRRGCGLMRVLCRLGIGGKIISDGESQQEPNDRWSASASESRRSRNACRPERA